MISVGGKSFLLVFFLVKFFGEMFCCHGPSQVACSGVLRGRRDEAQVCIPHPSQDLPRLELAALS